MPSHDEESDEFSENDPWGSDFETEDDLTDAGSVGAQDDFNDDEVEEDPYDSVEISPMLQRKRPVIDGTNNHRSAFSEDAVYFSHQHSPYKGRILLGSVEIFH